MSSINVLFHKAIILILSIFLLSVNALRSQNNHTIHIGKKNIGVLFIANGCYLNQKGEWSVNQNMIVGNDLLNKGALLDHFISFQIRPASIYGKNCFMFVKKRIHDEFTKSTIGQSFYVSYNLFDSIQFIKHISPFFDTTLLVKVKTIYFGKLDDINTDSTYTSNIENHIKNKAVPSFYIWDTLFQVKYYNKTSQIQFMCYDEFFKIPLNDFDSYFYQTPIVQFERLFDFEPGFATYITQQNTNDPVNIFSITEEIPKYPGGKKALDKFLDANLTLPKNNLEKYHVKFIVNINGKISNLVVINPTGDCLGCDTTISEVFQKMPAWIPAKQNGVIVPAYFNLYIKTKRYSNLIK